MIDFQNQEQYSISDINSLIKNEVEESIHLDYKEAGALDKSDLKKKEISKDVSAFANSDGGIIIYGVREFEHKAHSITFIDGNVFTKEWLEQTINASIQRRISGLRVIPIREGGGVDNTIYIVKIPKSLDAPHMCRDKKFYKRYNFESVAMEEFEIRQLYGLKSKSKLLLGRFAISLVENGSDEFFNLQIESDITNDGDIVENNYKINIYFTCNMPLKLHWDKHKTQIDYTHLGDRVKISATGIIPVYPNEHVTAIRFNLAVPKDNVDEALREMKIEAILFYSNGEDKNNYTNVIQGMKDKLLNLSETYENNVNKPDEY